MRVASRKACNLLAVFGFVFALGAQAQSTPEATVKLMMDAFNAGDMAKAASANASAGTNIIDEFAPYSWSGPKAFDEWGAALEADAKAEGITGPKVTMGAPLVHNVSEKSAYLVYPATYTYKKKGVSVREPARMAFALRLEGADWKIAAWTWTGTVPKPVN